MFIMSIIICRRSIAIQEVEVLHCLSLTTNESILYINKKLKYIFNVRYFLSRSSIFVQKYVNIARMGEAGNIRCEPHAR